MQPMSGHLAHTLKTLRRQRGWSLSQAAEQTGVSKAMLGQIEREESSPTVATLWKIATGFNVAFSAFLAPSSPPPTVQRQGALPAFIQENAAMRVTPLFPFDPQLGFDMFAIELAPGAFSESTPHEPGVIEHVVVLSGELELAIEDRWHRLAAGEAMRFQADRRHAYRNSGAQAAHIHDLIHYPRA
ncbi:putative transcriptional regulator [Serratia sp. FGI94]|uniref:helix-turn-helix domain-containing protein n=1 Tax=Serratia sp. FGI94 TaxID=671990 RepID=UPI0002A6FBAB|nr:XRE family transcriptional regulator [Serratia sp. FGI94]AGB82369.1 putative transcriptional regulator [Serratia sp. FGI94]